MHYKTVLYYFVIFHQFQPMITSLGVAEVIFPSQVKRMQVQYIIIASRCRNSPICFANFASEGSMASLTLRGLGFCDS